jgi:hypothetical protein
MDSALLWEQCLIKTFLVKINRITDLSLSMAQLKITITNSGRNVAEAKRALNIMD